MRGRRGTWEGPGWEREVEGREERRKKEHGVKARVEGGRAGGENRPFFNREREKDKSERGY
jgi:hypothetical protein